MGSATTGTGTLLWTTIRHDGRLFLPWMLGAIALSVSSVWAYPLTFPSEQDRAGLSAAVGANPALDLILGPAFDLSTVDGFNAWRSLALGGFLIGIGAILAVTRASRAQEDNGQAELLASGVLGRLSRLLGAVAVALLGSLVLGAVTAIVTGLIGGGWAASILLAATFTASGAMMTAVAALTAQIAADARTANSLAIGVLGGLYLARGLCYAVQAPEWTIWINPLGWLIETKPSAENLWWPLILALALSVIVLFLAFVLQNRRDFGQGFLGVRAGRDRGSMTTAFQLALRINRGPILTWIVVSLLLGVVFGYFTTSINDLLGDNSAVKQIFAAGAATPAGLVSAFLVTILSMTGIILAIPSVGIVAKIHSEETNDRLEPVLVAGSSRLRYYASNVFVSLLLSTVCMLIAGIIMGWIASASNVGIEFSTTLLQTLVTIPAVWAVVSVAALVIGVRPQLMLAAWLGVIISFVMTLLGPTLKFSDRVMALSPFWHLSNMADDAVDLWGVAGVTLVAAALLIIGAIGFRHRDIAR